jgi:hypothetical protein
MKWQGEEYRAVYGDSRWVCSGAGRDEGMKEACISKLGNAAKKQLRYSS